MIGIFLYIVFCSLECMGDCKFYIVKEDFRMEYVDVFIVCNDFFYVIFGGFG